MKIIMMMAVMKLISKHCDVNEDAVGFEVFDGGDYENCHVALVRTQFRRNVSPPSSG
jgi:hypothetical protein